MVSQVWEGRLSVFENGVMTKTFGTKWEKVTGEGGTERLMYEEQCLVEYR